MLIDYHMHTELTDGVGRPADYAAVAIERGLSEIGCSDHAPLADRETSWTMKKSDLPTYVGWVHEARTRYPGFSIKLGLEVDYIPGCATWVRELAAMYPWDYFLGSVHFIGDWPVDASATFWEDQDVDERWRSYFALWREAARSGLYDSLAHPDLPKKFNKRPVADLTELFADALKDVAAAGVAIEVSTGGLRKPCREIYPSRSFLAMARQLNIPVTLGSDAHLPQETGQDFDQSVALLRECGYRQICRFTQRRRELVDL
jgi:histidinol-phosphatase (PHP family)